jgi:hypothetical protein
MAIPSLTLRSVKGSALTFAEADTNFQNLANIQVGVSAGGTTSNVALNGTAGAPTAITFANSATIGASQTSGTVTLTSLVNPNNLTANVQANGQYIEFPIFNAYREKVAAHATTTGTITIDANVAPIQTITTTGNLTINASNLSNFASGESVTLLLRHNANNRIITSDLLFVNQTKTIGGHTSCVDAISIFYDGTSYLASTVKYQA